MPAAKAAKQIGAWERYLEKKASTHMADTGSYSRFSSSVYSVSRLIGAETVVDMLCNDFSKTCDRTSNNIFIESVVKHALDDKKFSWIWNG